MDIKEIINPLDKLKIRPVPKKFVKSVFLLEGDKNDTKECIFTDDRKNVKINRGEILKNIIKNNAAKILLPQDKPIIVKNVPQKILLKQSIVDEDDESSSSSSDDESSSSDEDEESSSDEDEESSSSSDEEDKKSKVKNKKVNIKKEKKVKEESDDEESDDEESDEESDSDNNSIVIKNKNVLNIEKLRDGIPEKKQPIRLKTSTYYLNNRKIFIQKLDKLFLEYKKDSEKNSSTDNELLLHQKIAREYLNANTPYRGLLLFYGLGTGKSATAVAIAEGLKSDKRIYLMIPASLETSFMNEIKKFGDPIFREKQHWVFVSINGEPENINILFKLLNIPKQTIKKRGGAWLMNINKPSNFDSLKQSQKEEINDQLIEMIKSKYYQINYNGNNLKKIVDKLSKNDTINPFDNSVIIVDEAHKLVSNIVNKLNKGGESHKTIAVRLYYLLMTASNCRIVLLTGTPIVNYPNEIAVLFNILRGTIKRWDFSINNDKKITTEYILDLFHKNNLYTFDYVNVSNGKIQITRNPFGFINKYIGDGGNGRDGGDNEKKGGKKTLKNIIKLQHRTKRGQQGQQEGGFGELEKYRGVELDETGNISDSQFEKNILDIFSKNNIQIFGSPNIVLNKALPDTLEEFKDKFLNMEKFENPKFKDKQDSIFIKRILGLTSYYSVSDNDPNLPELIDSKTDLFHTQYCPMSEYQFSVYREARKKEVEKQKKALKMKNKNKGDVYEVASSYRVLSRASCTFVFPDPPGRPFNNKGANDKDGDKGEEESDEEDNEDEDNGEKRDKEDEEDKDENGEQLENNSEKTALKFLKDHQETVLSKDGLKMYSPKFLKVLENITDPENVGLHLAYSQFRSLEGIGILKLVLEANGFVEFKLKKTGGEWTIQDFDKGKPTFALYTGREEQEEKELIRNIYNGDWQNVPPKISKELLKISSNNLYGEIIKVLMITSAAAEGINLRNTRFVHLIEPYWHMVRLQQVIGRARRYQSHLQLPKKYQNVKVLLYLATFSDEQIYKVNHTIGEGELKATDISKRKPHPLFTTDQTLFELSEIKQKLSNEILHFVKTAAVDCQLHHKIGDSYTCYDFGNVSSNAFSTKPMLEEDILEKADDKKAVGKVVGLVIKKIEYFANYNDKNDPDIKMLNLYSDKQLQNLVGVFDKANKKIV